MKLKHPGQTIKSPPGFYGMDLKTSGKGEESNQLWRDVDSTAPRNMGLCFSESLNFPTVKWNYDIQNAWSEASEASCEKSVRTDLTVKSCELHRESNGETVLRGRIAVLQSSL